MAIDPGPRARNRAISAASIVSGQLPGGTKEADGYHLPKDATGR